ncbi:hypothetical protein SDJN02_05836, partial [Cucurbita argyrosperma subsp. argyrosperma]
MNIWVVIVIVLLSCLLLSIAAISSLTCVLPSIHDFCRDIYLNPKSNGSKMGRILFHNSNELSKSNFSLIIVGSWQ